MGITDVQWTELLASTDNLGEKKKKKAREDRLKALSRDFLHTVVGVANWMNTRNGDGPPAVCVSFQLPKGVSVDIITKTLFDDGKTPFTKFYVSGDCEADSYDAIKSLSAVWKTVPLDLADRPLGTWAVYRQTLDDYLVDYHVFDFAILAQPRTMMGRCRLILPKQRMRAGTTTIQNAVCLGEVGAADVMSRIGTAPTVKLCDTKSLDAGTEMDPERSDWEYKQIPMPKVGDYTSAHRVPH